MMNVDNGFTGISHIGIVVPDIEIAFKQYSLLGFRERHEGVITEKEHGIYAKVIENNGYVLELMSPIDDPDKCKYADLLKQKRYCMDHICYRVDSLEKAVEGLKMNGFMAISKISFSSVWDKKVILLGNRKMGVIELMEDPETDLNK